MDDPPRCPPRWCRTGFHETAQSLPARAPTMSFAGDGCYRRKAFQRYFSSPHRTGLWRLAQPRPVERARSCGAVWRGSARNPPGAPRGHRHRLGLDTARVELVEARPGMELASVFLNTLALKVGRSLDDAKSLGAHTVFDPAIVHFGLSLDDRLKVRGRVGKSISCANGRAAVCRAIMS